MGMRCLIIFITISFSTYIHAFEPPETHDAGKKALEAVVKTESVKAYLKKAENMLMKILPVERETAATIGSTAIMLTSGKIDTKNIKNMDLNMFGGKIRPDVTHSFREGETEAYVNFSIEW